MVTSLCGLVATLSVARVVVGVELAPRFADSPNSPALHPVYGNNLAQQITSTFDVTLCGLALGILAAAVVSRAAERSTPGSSRRPQARRRGERGGRTTRVPVGQARRAVGRGDHPHPRRCPRRGRRPAPTAEIPPLATRAPESFAVTTPGRGR